MYIYVCTMYHLWCICTVSIYMYVTCIICGVYVLYLYICMYHVSSVVYMYCIYIYVCNVYHLWCICTVSIYMYVTCIICGVNVLYCMYMYRISTISEAQIFWVTVNCGTLLAIIPDFYYLLHKKLV